MNLLLQFILTLLLFSFKSHQQSLKRNTFKNRIQLVHYFNSNTSKNTNILLKTDDTFYLSENEGETFTELRHSSLTTAADSKIYFDPYRVEQLIILTKSSVVLFSENYGKDLREIQLKIAPSPAADNFIFHPKQKNVLIYFTEECEGVFIKDCKRVYYYTDRFSSNGGGSEVVFTKFIDDVRMCLLHSEDIIVCSTTSSTLVYSRDFFKSGMNKVEFKEDYQDIVSFGKSTSDDFIIVALRLSSGSLDLFTSKNGVDYYNTQFLSDNKIKESAYTVLESPSYELIVGLFSGGYDNQLQSTIIITPFNGLTRISGVGMAKLFYSDSEGRFFREMKNYQSSSNSELYVNRNLIGIIDYERVQGVDGIVLANFVQNYHDVMYGNAVKKIESMISYDDGRSFRYLNPPRKNYEGKEYSCHSTGGDGKEGDAKCSLNLFSVTSQSSKNSLGVVYSDAGVPGVIMGLGCVGDYLCEYRESELFISRDYGISWASLRKGPHKYETGDSGGFIVVVEDYGTSVGEVYFSHDYGATFNTVKLEKKMLVSKILNDEGSTSLKFLLVGEEDPAGGNPGVFSKESVTVQLDFSKYFSQQCQSSDYEQIEARDINEDLKCFFGRNQAFQRRKQDAKCYVGRYREPMMVKNDPCECTDENYECDTNFVYDLKEKKCVFEEGKTLPVVPAGACKSKGDTFMGSSGYRKIPGDFCVNGIKKDQLKSYQCPENTHDQPQNVVASSHFFEKYVQDHFYMTNSSTVIVRLAGGQLLRGENDGATYTVVSLNGKATGTDVFIVSVREHDHVAGRVFVTTTTGELWYSDDYAKNFRQITVKAKPSTITPSFLDFHPSKPDWLLYVGQNCNPGCSTFVSVSEDNGQNWSSEVTTYAHKCLFAQDTGFKNVNERGVFCSEYRNKFGTQDSYGGRTQTPDGNVLQLKLYPDFTNSQVPVLIQDRIIDYYVFEQYLAVAKESFSHAELYTSTNGTAVSQVKYPPTMKSLETSTFTILQSPTGRIFINVAKSTASGREYGALLVSDSSGLFFSPSLDNINMNSMGYVDFERLKATAGVLIANRVFNANSMGTQGKQIKTVISYDDGNTWNPIDGPGAECNEKNIAQDKCKLHLHGRSELSQETAFYSVDTAPGLVMAVGNVGATLEAYSSGDTFLSKDSGRTWKKVANGPQRFIFADHGGILAYVADDKDTTVVSYSLNRGSTWFDVQFHDKPVRVQSLQIDTGMTGLEFLIYGLVSDSSSSNRYYVGRINLSKVFDRKCSADSDYEKFYVKSDANFCFLGQRTDFSRRKDDAMCFVGEDYSPLPSVSTSCPCSENDLECDFGFYRNRTNGNKCDLIDGTDPDMPQNCVGTYKGRSGYRVNPASKCQGKETLTKYLQPVTRNCGKTTDNTGKGSKMTEFTAPLSKIIYFVNTTRILGLDSTGKLHVSKNSGYSWDDSIQIPQDALTKMVQNPYFKERVYLLTRSNKYYYSNNNASTFNLGFLPANPNTFGAPVLEFHAEEPDWIIFTGQSDTACPSGNDCKTMAYVTRDNGEKWEKFNEYVRDCEWGRDALFKNIAKSAVFCDQYSDKSGNQKSKRYEDAFLYKSETFFASSEKVLNDPLVGFAVNENFLVAAVSKSTSSGRYLELQVSTDGQAFNSAVFPKGYDSISDVFTVLDSVRGSVFLNVRISSKYGSEWGTLFISNKDGNMFSVSVDNVNQNFDGFVDYEPILGMPGLAVINQVANPEESSGGMKKKLKTLITYNQGGLWTPMKATGELQGLCQDKSNCFVHLHSYTEKKVVKNEISDPGAAGILIGVGSVGAYLDEYEKSYMLVTRDAGKSWSKMPVDGPHLFEFGDHGGLILIVPANKPTTKVYYSLDYGASFNDYNLPVIGDFYAERILTESDATSLSFVLFGKTLDGSSPNKAVYLDFNDIIGKQCADDDYEQWSFMSGVDSAAPECVLGAAMSFKRRKQNSSCKVGEAFTTSPVVVKKCACSKYDFECAPGYTRDSSTHECKSTGNTEPSWGDCIDGVQYFGSAYRLVALSQCSGGERLDKTSTSRTCSMSGSSAGGMSAAGVFFSVTIPLILLGVGGFAYYRWKQGNPIELPKFDSAWWSEFVNRFRRVRYDPLQSDDNDLDVLMDDYP